MFDLSAQAFKRLRLTRYVVLRLNYSINCNNLYLKLRLQIFKEISTEKEIKYTFSSKHLFGSWKLTVIVLYIYNRESTSMCCVSLTVCIVLFRELVIK